LKPSVQPRSWSFQQMSTSSPAMRNCSSNPPTACSADFAERHVAAGQMFGS
jgi:hypothetical protein